MKMDNNFLDECLDVRRLTEDLWNTYLLQNDGTSVYVSDSCGDYELFWRLFWSQMVQKNEKANVGFHFT